MRNSPMRLRPAGWPCGWRGSTSAVRSSSCRTRRGTGGWSGKLKADGVREEAHGPQPVGLSADPYSLCEHVGEHALDVLVADAAEDVPAVGDIHLRRAVGQA